MKVGSLFAGIGGFDLGLERAGMHVRWQVENNTWCQKVLTKHWPEVSRYEDIKTVDWQTIEPVDLVCGGFPCQPFSVAGKRGGQADDRYLWPEVVRCLSALRPTWFLGENVPGIVKLALDQVYTDLEDLGYAVQAFNIPACAVDAPHQRKRIWIVGYAKSHAERRIREASRQQQIQARGSGPRPEDVADAKGQQTRGIFKRQFQADASASGNGAREALPWPTEPSVGRVAYGVPRRVDRLRGLGNAVVPQVAEVLGRAIYAVEQGKEGIA